MNETCPHPPVLFFKIWFIVILPCTPSSWKQSVFQFSHQRPACILLLFEACRMPPFIILDHCSKIRQGTHILQLLIVLFVQLNAYWHGVKVLDSRTRVIITAVLSRKLELLLCVNVISFNYKCVRSWYRVNSTEGRGLHETKTWYIVVLFFVIPVKNYNRKKLLFCKFT